MQQGPKKLFNALSRKSDEPEPIESHQSLYEGINLQNITPEDLNKIDIVEITSENPLEALAKFQEAVVSGSNQIPVFSGKAHAKVHEWLGESASPDQVKSYHYLLANSQKKFIHFTNQGKQGQQVTLDAESPSQSLAQESVLSVQDKREQVMRDMAKVLIKVDELRTLDDPVQIDRFAVITINHLNRVIDNIAREKHHIETQLGEDPTNQSLLNQRDEYQEIYQALIGLKQNTMRFGSANQIMNMPDGAKKQARIDQHPNYQFDHQYFINTPFNVPAEMEQLKQSIIQDELDRSMTPLSPELQQQCTQITKPVMVAIDANIHNCSTQYPQDRKSLLAIMRKNKEDISNIMKARQDLIALKEQNPGIGGFQEQFDGMFEKLQAAKNLQKDLEQTYHCQAKVAINQQLLGDIVSKLENPKASGKKTLKAKQVALVNECEELSASLASIEARVKAMPYDSGLEVTQHLIDNPLHSSQTSTQAQQLQTLQDMSHANRNTGQTSLQGEPTPQSDMLSLRDHQASRQETIALASDASMRVPLSDENFSSFIGLVA